MLTETQINILKVARNHNLKISNKTNLDEDKLTVNSMTAKSLVKLGFGLIQGEQTVKRGTHLEFLVITSAGRDFVDALTVQPEPVTAREEPELKEKKQVNKPIKKQEDKTKPWIVECVVCGEKGLRLIYNSDGTCSEYCKHINRTKQEEFAALGPLPELVDFSDIKLTEDELKEVDDDGEDEEDDEVEPIIPDKVELKAEIFWGKKWNGRYHEETPGQGCYVQLTEVGPTRSFKGCPTGCGPNIEEALSDFYNRSKFEYIYDNYSLDKLEVVEEVDYRDLHDATEEVPKSPISKKIIPGLERCLGCGAQCNPHFLDAGYCGKRKCAKMRGAGVSATEKLGVDPISVLRQPRFEQARKEFKKENAKLHVHIHLNRKSTPSMEGSELVPTTREEFDKMSWGDWTRVMRNIVKCEQQKGESRFDYEERCWDNVVKYWNERGVTILGE